MTHNGFSISVILPNYNGRKLLESNLPSLIDALKKYKYDSEVIVVDDCSSDDSIDFLTKQYPEIIIEKNEINSGFSSTCNKGVFSASKKLLCIANTDVSFSADYFTNALPAFSDSTVFSVKGDIINYDVEPDKISSIENASSLYFKHGLLRSSTRIKPDPNLLTGKVGDQFTLLGCCFICDRDKMLTLGGYDEIYSPFYWEDSDLPLRAVQKGYKLAYIPECISYHKTSSTISKHIPDIRRRLVSSRNKFIFTWGHLKGFRNWMTHILFTSLNILVRWIILDWKYYVTFSTALYRQINFKRPKHEDT
jgi:GT2 family glycosyltransferase